MRPVILCLVAVSAAAYLACQGDGDGSANPSATAGGTGDPCAESGIGYLCECFDSADESHFKVLYPNGGETLLAGTIDTIRFCVEIDDEACFGGAVFKLSVDGGKSWTELWPGQLDTPERRPWLIPARIQGDNGMVSTASAQCLLRVEVYDVAGDPSVDYDVSDGFFTVAGE